MTPSANSIRKRRLFGYVVLFGSNCVWVRPVAPEIKCHCGRTRSIHMRMHKVSLTRNQASPSALVCARDLLIAPVNSASLSLATQAGRGTRRVKIAPVQRANRPEPCAKHHVSRSRCGVNKWDACPTLARWSYTTLSSTTALLT